MAIPAEDILQDLFNMPASNVDAAQLQQLAAEVPYFGAAHFLLARNLYQSGNEGLEQALQKAVLHFPDELLFHYSMNAENIPAEINVKGDEINTPNQTTAIGNAEVLEEVLPVVQENKIADEPAEEPVAAMEKENAADEEGDLNDFTEEAIINDKLSSLLQQQAAALEKPVEGPVAELIIETIPQHRIDYFASQGIKLEELKTNDKLDKQLRRFTDWLKQMKSINPSPTELQNDEAGEQRVQNIAQHSNEAEAVVTEAMAEVLVKQGKPGQAIKIYEKLSFINPSKSAYFAAKIEELKVS